MLNKNKTKLKLFSYQTNTKNVSQKESSEPCKPRRDAYNRIDMSKVDVK